MRPTKEEAGLIFPASLWHSTEPVLRNCSVWGVGNQWTESQAGTGLREQESRPRVVPGSTEFSCTEQECQRKNGKEMQGLHEAWTFFRPGKSKVGDEVLKAQSPLSVPSNPLYFRTS